MRRITAAAAAAWIALAGSALASEGGHPVPALSWSFSGFFGTFDRGAVQRGFQVYKEACASCHGMKLVFYRNLGAIGFSEEQVKAIAAQNEVSDGPNDQGEMFTRPARPSDRFKSPFANEQAARAANNGAYPPDLSVITKARMNGPNYLHALLTGYQEPPPGMTLLAGMNYNPYFPGGQIAMPKILNDGLVTYADGTTASADQMAHDVATFLSWASEPEMEVRKRLGVKAFLFLIVLTVLLYAVKRKVWAELH